MSEIADLEKVLLIAAAESDFRNLEKPATSEDTQPEQSFAEHPKKFETDAPKQRNTSIKRKADEEQEETNSNGYANIVATHYNQLEEKGLVERSKSRIFHLRNFHNWIKSMLINEALSKIKEGKKHNVPVRVHDMGCGKGGDLSKWKIGGISHLICSDIASVSLEHCKARYDDRKNRASRERGPNNMFSVEYIAADCSRVRLREKYSDPSMKLDLVSCQFAFHYSFESLPQAECWLRNAGECLQPGGYFIGTILDANDLIARARKCKSGSYGNQVYQVKLGFDYYKPPLFGAKYNFSLEGSVDDCPEFLVHFPTLVKLAKKFGLKLVRKEKFHVFYERLKDEGRQLLYNMRSLEAYPPPESATLAGIDPEDYTHAKEFVEKQGPNVKIGTISKSEWEASSLTSPSYLKK